MTWRAAVTHEVILENWRVPQKNLLGDPSRSFAQHLAVFETGRISVGALSVGEDQICMDQSLRYARERIQFGQPILNF